jgi:hypothetical protein
LPFSAGFKNQNNTDNDPKFIYYIVRFRNKRSIWVLKTDGKTSGNPLSPVMRTQENRSNLIKIPVVIRDVGRRLLTIIGKYGV